MGLREEWRTVRVAFGHNLASAMAIRGAFVLQIVGMVVNDLAYIAVWLLFFGVFGNVNGWTSAETFALMGLGTMTFGLVFGFVGGTIRLPSIIANGKLDPFLLTPRNVLVRILTHTIDIPALGDFIFGAAMLVIYAVLKGLSWGSIALLFGLVPAGAIITMSVSLMVACIIFFIPEDEGVSHRLFMVFLRPSQFPAGAYPDGLRMLFTFLIPSLLVTGLPIEVAQTQNVQMFLLIWALAFVWFGLSILTFTRALRRYESGNQLGGV